MPFVREPSRTRPGGAHPAPAAARAGSPWSSSPPIIILWLQLAIHILAGPTVVLEGFENGFTTNSLGVVSLAPFTNYGTPRGAPVTVSLYTSSTPGDPRVTEGTNSAKIVFPSDGFGNDLGFALSDSATVLVEEAAASGQVARYILRYDVVFEHIDRLSYFNQHFLIGNEWDYLRAAGAATTNFQGVKFGVASFSMPLDLPALALPTNGPSFNAGDFAAQAIPGLTALIADQFAGASGTLHNFTIYLDNVRLIDTYNSAATTPAVYGLQSFENPASPLGGATDLTSPNTVLARYATNGLYDSGSDAGVPGVYTDPNDTFDQASDFAVTDGGHALEVQNKVANYSSSAFRLPLVNNRLSQVLKLNLPLSELSRYTLRWDTTMPPVPLNGKDVDFLNIDYSTPSGTLQMSQGRRQSSGQTGLQRVTYSETLDRIVGWGSGPALTFSFSQPPAWVGSEFLFDNFVLLDTAPEYTEIRSASYDPASRQFRLVWRSSPNQTYSIEFSTALAGAFTNSLAAGIPSGGDFTTNSVALPAGSDGWLRVRTQ